MLLLLLLLLGGCDKLARINAAHVLVVRMMVMVHESGMMVGSNRGGSGGASLMVVMVWICGHVRMACVVVRVLLVRGMVMVNRVQGQVRAVGVVMVARSHNRLQRM